MLLLVIGGAALGAATAFVSTTRLTAHGALTLAAVTFGLYEAVLIGDAFDDFGSMGTGGWLGSVGALILLLGVAKLWQTATTIPARRPSTAGAPPPAA